MPTNDPIIHTALPKDSDGHRGEYDLGQMLRTFSGQGFQFWFDLNYLPNVPDIDLLLYSKKVGVFICEVKNFTMQQIKSYTLNSFQTTTKYVPQHPVKQVRRNQQQLKSFHARMLSEDGLEDIVPFLQTTVIWPRITRAQWEQRFSSAALRSQSRSFIFQDDLLNARTLIEKLSEFAHAPLLGVHPPLHRPQEKAGIESLATYIKDTKRETDKAIGQTEPQQRDVSYLERELNKYPFGETHRVLVSGVAGTGKTTFLQHLGVQHAISGGSVLYLCYNRALATEVRKQIQVLRSDETMTGHIDVFDQFAFYESLAPEVKVLGHDAKAKDVILCLKKLPKEEIPSYDTILIDEGQDIDGDAIKLAKFLSTSDTSWFASISKGQELYGFNEVREFPCKELSEIMETASKPARNRLFRGGEIPFLTTYAFHTYFPKIEKVKKFIEDKVLSQRYQVGEIEQQANLPKQATHLSINYIPAEEQQFSQAVRSVVLETLHEVKETGANADLMIIVFGEKSPAYPIIKSVLREAKQQVHDLSLENNRRIQTPAGAVRIVKAMGSRGLSASHVLVFDFEYIQPWCEQGHGRAPALNLANVVLSRATSSTKIVVNVELVNEQVRFLEEIISELRIARLK